MVVGKYRRKTLQFSDKRVKLMNEILNGIRIIKFYAWEKPFSKHVDKHREDELKALTMLSYISAIGFSLILLSVPVIQPVIVFATYVKINVEPLDAAKAFTTIALFNLMRFPFAFMPMGLLQLVQAMISIRRMEFYLQLPELVDYVENIPPPMKKKRGSRKSSVKKSVVDESSDVTDTKLTLVDINCLIKKGELVAVVGKVGSGKSSFLSLLL